MNFELTARLITFFRLTGLSEALESLWKSTQKKL